MSEIKKLGYKPDLFYEDNYESEILYNNKENLENEDIESQEDNIIDELIDNTNKLDSLINSLPDNIKDKVEEIYDQVKDYIDNELSDKEYQKVPTEEDWTYKENEVDLSPDTSEDVTLDTWNPDPGWIDDDFFPMDKESHTEKEIIDKEYIKNLVDLFDSYNSNLKGILSNFWTNFLLASTNKNSSEIKMLLNNIVLSSSDITNDAKHLLDSAVRQSIMKNVKMQYFSTIYNAEETIKHLKQLKAVQELRLRYADIEEQTGDTKTNQMNNNILKASKMIYDKKYDLAYENLYRYLNSSNIVLNDSLQSYIQEIKSKQILIERNGIR